MIRIVEGGVEWEKGSVQTLLALSISRIFYVKSKELYLALWLFGIINGLVVRVGCLVFSEDTGEYIVVGTIEMVSS